MESIENSRQLNDIMIKVNKLCVDKKFGSRN